MMIKPIRKTIKGYKMVITQSPKDSKMVCVEVKLKFAKGDDVLKRSAVERALNGLLKKRIGGRYILFVELTENQSHRRNYPVLVDLYAYSDDCGDLGEMVAEVLDEFEKMGLAKIIR